MSDEKLINIVKKNISSVVRVDSFHVKNMINAKLIVFYTNQNKIKRKSIQEKMFFLKKEMSKYDNFFLYTYFVDALNNEGIKICIKENKNVPIEVEEKLYHISPIENREKILENGLTKQRFYKSKNRTKLNYYHKPAIFLTKNKHDAIFIFHEKNYDIWEINTKNLKNKWYYDCNMGNDENFIMTYENIKSEFVKLFLLKK